MLKQDGKNARFRSQFENRPCRIRSRKITPEGSL